MKAVLVQADSMQPDREDGGKGLVLIGDAGLLLVWGGGQTAGAVKPGRLYVVECKND
jgi:hypothetical protein